MVTVVDINTLYKEKRGKALDLVQRLTSLTHPNLMQIRKWWYIADQSIFIESESPCNALSPGAFEGSFNESPQYIDVNMQE